MAELTAGSQASQLSRTFFLGMAVAMAAIVFGGFGLSYFLPMASGALPALAPVVHVHGAFYFAWMILLVVQAALVQSGNVALHRSLGQVGIALGSGLLIFGSIVTSLFAARALAGDDATVYGLTYISLLALLGFALLFFLAIRNVRNPAAHKRYILLATAVFLIGGINRIYAVLFGLEFDSHLTYLPKYLTVDAFVAALLLYDWRTLGRIHTATAIGASVNVLPQLLHVPIVESGAYVALTHWLAALAYY